MKLDDAIDEALQSPEPLRKLREVALDRFARGADKQTLLGLFEDARRQLRQTGRDADEDVVMEVMDFLVGWCSPHVRLEPETERNLHANGLSGLPEQDAEKTRGPAEGTHGDGKE